jgi:hypothetical protein
VAVVGKEVEILGIGTTPVQYSNGAFVLNMLFRKGGWEVRKGFGQRAEYTTTFSTRFFDEGGTQEFSAKPQGFLNHLGSYLYKTQDFRQIISVFASAFLPGNKQDDNAVADGYLVQIYDVDRDVRWEEAIYPQTGQNDRGSTPLATQHGVYETSRDNDYASFDHGRIEPFFFTEHEDLLFFGSEASGVLFYKPTRFRERKRQQLDTTFFREASGQGSETSIIRRIDPMNGTVENQLAFEYLTGNSLSGIRDMASIGFATAVAAGSAIYFSDEDSPFAFTTENIVPIPTKYKILAIEEHLGNLLIWTESESWHYTPSQGNVKSAGRLTKISDLIGCLGPQSVTKMPQGVAWVGANGIYSTQNGLQHQVISEPVKSFFNEFITNPITNFYQDNGTTDILNPLPNSIYRFSPLAVNIAHSPSENILVVSFPQENMALALTEGKWSVWSFDSNVFVDGGVSEVGVKENIRNGYVLADADGLFMVGSVFSQNLTDSIQRWSTGTNSFSDLNRDVEARSYAIMEYGRGGAIDRSIDNEDYREPRGQYIFTQWNAMRMQFIVDQWIKLPVGYVLPGGTVVAAANDVFLLPVNMTRFSGGLFNNLGFSFTFDSAQWVPILRGATTEIDIIVPSERQPTALGFGQGAPIAGVAEAQLYILPGGVPSSTGQEVRVFWASQAGGGPVGVPLLQTVAFVKNPLVYIPMQRIGTGATVSGMGFAVGSQATVPVSSDQVFWEQENMVTDLHREDSVSQPVDWAYKSVQVGLDTPVRLKARGLFIQMLSHGRGVQADYLEPDWLWGVFNTLLAGDFRGWTSQIIDYAGTITGSNQIERIANKQNIRARIIDSSSLLINKTFGSADVTYGDPAVDATGTYLIDDEEVDVIATSDGTKGHTITYMVFGHMQNRAQKIHLDSIKAVLREVGGRRRSGR